MEPGYQSTAAIARCSVQSDMPKTDQVPVFFRDQDDVCESPAHIWTREDCRAKRNLAGKFENSGRTFRLFAARPQVFPVSASSLKSSNVIEVADTISFSEVLANVGIAGNVGDPPDRRLVKRAQAKVRLYPQIHDDQAVLAAYARTDPPSNAPKCPDCNQPLRKLNEADGIKTWVCDHCREAAWQKHEARL